MSFKIEYLSYSRFQESIIQGLKRFYDNKGYFIKDNDIVKIAEEIESAMAEKGNITND